MVTNKIINALFYVSLIVFALIITGCSNAEDQQQIYQSTTRTYFIAAEDVVWDYAPNIDYSVEEKQDKLWLQQTKYNKTRFVEYTDKTFTVKKQQPAWLGILGPIIRGVEGDTITVVFYNKASQPYSMHPHGLLYDKDNEGASHEGHFHHTPAQGKGSKIQPGEKYTYTWKVSEESAPTAAEGGSKVWMYHSHVDAVEDIYAGLVGPIIITSAEHATAEGLPDDVDQEFVTLYLIFDESEENMNDDEKEGHLKHAINGYIFNNLRGLDMTEGDKVRWHLLGLGTEVDLHTSHWHGEQVKFNNKYTDVIELLPASMVSVDMKADNVGEWMLHCHVADHITAGMMALYTINPK